MKFSIFLYIWIGVFSLWVLHCGPTCVFPCFGFRSPSSPLLCFIAFYDYLWLIQSGSSVGFLCMSTIVTMSLCLVKVCCCASRMWPFLGDIFLYHFKTATYMQFDKVMLNSNFWNVRPTMQKRSFLDYLNNVCFNLVLFVLTYCVFDIFQKVKFCLALYTEEIN